MYRIVYRTTDGAVQYCRKMNSTTLAKNLAKAPNLASIDGRLENTRHRYVENGEVVIREPEVNVSDYIRITRRNLLMLSDWTQGADSPLTEAKRTEWAAYRQALRDLPDTTTATHIDQIEWPQQPG